MTQRLRTTALEDFLLVCFLRVREGTQGLGLIG